MLRSVQKFASPLMARGFAANPSITITQTGAMINNQWVAGSKSMETLNPATEEV